MTHPDERLEQDLVFAGLIGMIDPPRPEAKDAVARAKTRRDPAADDHGRPPAHRVRSSPRSLASPRMTASSRAAELDSLPEEARARTVAEVSVYARVNPEHKLRIVEALRRTGAVVAMTGDGVNDAPALKRADIGIAMGITGTDVSKEAADMVLADDNFASIVAAVEEGRAIFANIRKFLRYLLSSNIGEVLTMFFGVVLAGQIGLRRWRRRGRAAALATQILWINLVTDGPPALALGVDPADEELMHQPPRPVGEGVLTRACGAASSSSASLWLPGRSSCSTRRSPAGSSKASGDLRYAQTMAFTTLMLFQIFNVVNARSDEQSAFRHISSRTLAVGRDRISLTLQALVVYVPFLQRAFGKRLHSGRRLVVLFRRREFVMWLREITKAIVRHEAAVTNRRSADL